LIQILPNYQFFLKNSGFIDSHEGQVTTENATPLANEINDYLEALQAGINKSPASLQSGGSIRRVGNDLINLKELDREEIKYLAFAEEFKNMTPGKVPIFHGTSSDATLIMKAMEYKEHFTGAPVSIPGRCSRQRQGWECQDVRSSSNDFLLS
jgi:hypothetical protein